MEANLSSLLPPGTRKGMREHADAWVGGGGGVFKGMVSKILPWIGPILDGSNHRNPLPSPQRASKLHGLSIQTRIPRPASALLVSLVGKVNDFYCSVSRHSF